MSETLQQPKQKRTRPKVDAPYEKFALPLRNAKIFLNKSTCLRRDADIVTEIAAIDGGTEHIAHGRSRNWNTGIIRSICWMFVPLERSSTESNGWLVVTHSWKWCWFSIHDC